MRQRMAVLSLAILLLSLGRWAGAQEWNPAPYPGRGGADNARETDRRVTGRQSDMGEVVHAEGQAWLIEGGGEAETVSAAPAEEAAAAQSLRREILRVGDVVQMGDVVETDARSSVEILFGLNGRLRLDERTAVRFLDIDEAAAGGRALERRFLDLQRGRIRIRVRENTLHPAPVLVVGVGARVTVGRPELAVRGGIDAVIERKGEGAEAAASVGILNGAVLVERARTPRREAETVTLEQGLRLTFPPADDSLPPLDAMPVLSEEAVERLRSGNAFSVDPRLVAPRPPETRDHEMDGA